MAKKYYAVKVGKTPGIYETWPECQEQINGISGAVYKGFATKEEAQSFIGMESEKKQEIKVAKSIDMIKTEAIAYVDGSYDDKTKSFSCGVVLFVKGKELHFANKYTDSTLADMNNVAGEIKGSEVAIQYCLDHDIKSITIYHDYEGIAKWCNGEWKAKKEGTIAYANYYKQASQKLHIQFIKVKGHSGDKYNDMADELAKTALGIKSTNSSHGEEYIMPKNKGVFIERESLVENIRKIGEEKWDEFQASDLVLIGTAYRCNIKADGNAAMINFYFNGDGTTTITPTGNNTEISIAIKTLLESSAFTGNVQGKTYSIKKLPSDWADKLIDYLASLENVTLEEASVSAPLRRSCIFVSSIGDKLTVHIYQNRTLTLQGKPAYLYSEAISFISYCNDVSMDDIVDSVNNFHDIDIKIKDVRNEMESLMPNAYANIDPTLLKLLSPSVTLRKIAVPLEDYSSFAFSALRTLEGYIKYLLGIKSVTVGYTFGGVFSESTLIGNAVTLVGDAKYQGELERLFDYFRGNRHVYFHTEQILIGTTLIEDKKEADEIVNTVIDLIETSYTNLFK